MKVKLCLLAILISTIIAIGTLTHAQAENDETFTPSTPDLLCPVDTATPSTFNFVMTKPSNATWITIQVDQGNDRIYKESFPIQTVCKFKYCKVNLNTTLPLGNYTWYAIAWNNNALFGSWSDPANFEVTSYGLHETECCNPFNNNSTGFINTIEQILPSN